MIAKIRGVVSEIENGNVIIESNGIGYEVLATREALMNIIIGEEIYIDTYLQVREDGLSLYGFSSREEKKLFEKLITVSGVGPKAAMSILSQLGCEGLQTAIASDDAKSIAKSPGIGNKTAQKIILELHDKVSLADIMVAGKSIVLSNVKMTNNAMDACLALTALGFKEAESIAAIKSIEGIEEMDSDRILALALKKLG